MGWRKSLSLSHSFFPSLYLTHLLSLVCFLVLCTTFQGCCKQELSNESVKKTIDSLEGGLGKRFQSTVKSHTATVKLTWGSRRKTVSVFWRKPLHEVSCPQGRAHTWWSDFCLWIDVFFSILIFKALKVAITMFQWGWESLKAKSIQTFPMGGLTD